MWTIGLTGGIGSGKSTVAEWFRSQGIPILDADKTVHRLLKEDKDVLFLIKREFGHNVIGEDQKIDRKALGKIIFNDQKSRKLLEGIIHPRVVSIMQNTQIELKKKGLRLCIWDVPLLLEAGFAKLVNEVWVVWVPQSQQIQRVIKRDKLSLDEVLARINSQMPLDEKKAKADVVIDNSGEWADTVKQLEYELKRLYAQ